MKYFIFFVFIFFYACNVSEKSNDWQMRPFVKVDQYNPVLAPSESPIFSCPIREEVVNWEAKDVFNPAAVMKDGKFYMIYRAEDTVGKHSGTSRLGLAISDDGFTFKKMPEPVFYPDHDDMKIYEWEGGVEDPRIVESEDGKYIMTYTSYDGKTARLCLASSDDLMTWQKHGLVLSDDAHKDKWSKSGAIVCRVEGSRLVAHKINGKYWMYFGDTDIFAATSDDLIYWQPLTNVNGEWTTVFGPRQGKFDSQLVEPGPPPIMTEHGILMVYNSRNLPEVGDTTLPEGTYAAGQILLNPKQPTEVLDRSEDYFFKPDKDYEILGQINNVCFLEAWVPHDGKWYMYYGTADSKIAVATYEE